MNSTAANQVFFTSEEFSSQQARNLITGFIKEKINFYKLERLSLIIADETADTSWFDNKIKELNVRLKDTETLALDAGSTGKKLSIEENVILKIVD